MLRHRNLAVYLHLDAHASTDHFRSTLERAAADGVVLLERRRSRWGGREVVDASLDGLSRAALDGSRYFLLISGQDFPLRPVDEILDWTGEHISTSYIEHWPIPSRQWRYGGLDRIEFYTYTVRGRRETAIPLAEARHALNIRGRLMNYALCLRGRFQPPRRFPPYVQPVGGRQWWNLSLDAVHYILSFLDAHPDYLRYHAHTLLPDEIFFQSILLGTDFALRSEIVNDSLRFMRWEADSSHPRILTEADLPTMLQSNALFARKFDVETDEPALRRLADRVSGAVR